MKSLRNLTKQDIEILKNFGYLDTDLPQISKAITKTNYFYNHNGKEEKITHQKARELLGNEQFLSGISRSAFHYTSYRKVEENGGIFFDSEKMFKEFEKEAQIEKEIIKTLDGWHKSPHNYIADYLQIGDTIDEDMYNYFLNILPPQTMHSRLLQVGGACNHLKDEDGKLRPTFLTFAKNNNGNWEFKGECFNREWINRNILLENNPEQKNELTVEELQELLDEPDICE